MGDYRHQRRIENNTMKAHVLKVWPRFFDSLVNNNKPFEIRKNDRDFDVGDILILCQTDVNAASPSACLTGRKVVREITYITDFEQKPGFVVLGIKPV